MKVRVQVPGQFAGEVELPAEATVETLLAAVAPDAAPSSFRVSVNERPVSASEPLKSRDRVRIEAIRRIDVD